MFKLYLCILLSATSSLIHGMYLLGDIFDDFSSFSYGYRQLSPEETKKQEKEDYDKLHALVLSKISGNEDLNQQMLDTLAEKTLLHKSCTGGDAYLPIIQLLLTHGANPNVIDTHKSTPLHKSGRHECY